MHAVMCVQAYGAANQGYAAQPDMRSPLHGQVNTNQVPHAHKCSPLLGLVESYRPFSLSACCMALCRKARPLPVNLASRGR